MLHVPLWQRFVMLPACVLLILALSLMTLRPQVAFAQSSTVSINPTQGPAGTKVSSTGSNWVANDQIQVTWDDNTVLANTEAGNNDTFTVSFTVPANATQGAHTVYFTDLTARYFIPTTFTVTMSTPTHLTVDRVWTGDANNNPKTSFAPGDTIHYLIQVTNAGSSTVNATFDFLATGPQQLYHWSGNADIAPGTDGFYSPSTVPSIAPAGTYTITVTVTYNSITVQGKSQFTVVSTTSKEPAWALPFPTGSSIYIGPLGLHGDNFRSMVDDSPPHKVFTFKNPTNPDSLDIVLASPTPGGTSSTPTTSLGNGSVLAVWSACQVVLINYSNGWWAIYLHMARIQVKSGNTVTTGSAIGYPTTKKPTLAACGNVESNVEHVHIALLKGSGTSGSYVPMLGMKLCGHTVVEQNNDPTNILLQGLTQKKDQVFRVPVCSRTT